MVKKDSGLTYEVHERILGMFVWHVFDADGNVVHQWDETRVVEGEGEDARETDHGIWFRSERDAKEYVEDKYGATCKTVFSEG